MSQRKTVTCPNPDVLAQAVAVRVLTTIRNLLAEPGRSRVDIALTGGTDGNRVLRAIGTDPLADDLDASRVHIWWGDERFVPEDSDDRNAKQARRFLNILVERGLMPEENIHEMPADTRDAAQIAAATDEENDAVLADAAAAYQKELIEQLGEEPTLDIALFGVGPDAHFASLFPGRPEVLIDDPHVLVAGVRDSPKPPPLRVTLTVPMIARSRRTWVFASGERKADAVAAAFAQPRNPQAPSSFADGEELIWYIDHRIVRYLKIVISDSETIRGFRGTKQQRCTVLPFRATSPVVKYDLIGVHHGMRLRPVCQSWRCGSTIVLDNPVVLRISFTPPEGSLRARCGPACEWDAAQEARRVATPMRVQLPRNGIMRALYGAESVQQPLKTIAPTVVHRRSSWKRWNSNEMRNGVRGLSGRCMYNCCVCLQCARCTGGYAPPAVTGR